MAKIRVEWLHDSHSCETCGTSYAEGARVFIDGEKAIELEPSAHCFGGADYQQDAVFAAIIKHLGHELEC